MSKPLFVKVIVEGQTEESFINEVVAPYLQMQQIYIQPILLTKKGQKGGGVKFERVEKDVYRYLQERNVAAVTSFVDYYGLEEWPDKDEIPAHATPGQIAGILNDAAKKTICQKHDDLDPEHRYLPFMMVHEFETLLFSDSAILARILDVESSKVDAILSEAQDEPERINNSRDTAPSKRLDHLKRGYQKITDGLAIAQAIGIDKMRAACPLFNKWLSAIESLQKGA